MRLSEASRLLNFINTLFIVKAKAEKITKKKESVKTKTFKIKGF